MAKVTNRKANAIGFTKRKSRKAQSGITDVYEFQQEKVRRSNVPLSLGRDEVGRKDHSDEEHQEDALKGARLIGEHMDDEKIDSDDDEDIDSDAAFGDSDEETFAGYGFKRQVRCFLFKSTGYALHLITGNIDQEETFGAVRRRRSERRR